MPLPLPRRDWTPAPADGRAIPAFWVRRVVFIDRLGQPFRMDRRFHRGLNILWAKEDNEGGHGAGKTTLCQFIRHCLGEPSYGSERLVKAMIEKFPFGYIGAEIVLGDTPWSVLRPVQETKDNPALCEQGVTLEQLIEAKEGDPYDEFKKAFHKALFERVQPTQDIRNLPERLLAWLSRDQEARYEDLHQWRRATSGSGVSNPRKDEAHRVIRHVLGIITSDETQARQKLKEAEDALNKARETTRKAEGDVATLRWQLAHDFGFTERQLIDDGLMFDENGAPAVKGRRLLEARLEEAKTRLEEIDGNEELSRLRSLEAELNKKIGGMERDEKDLRKKLEETDNKVQREQSYLDDKISLTQYHEIEIPCDNCGEKPSDIRKMLGRSQGSNVVNIDLIQAKIEKEHAKKRLARFKDEVTDINARIKALLENDLEPARKDLTGVQMSLRTLEAKLAVQRREASIAVARFQTALQAWDDYLPKQEALEQAMKDEQAAESAREKASYIMEQGFIAHHERLEKLGQDFRKVTRQILRPPYDGKLNVSKDGEVKPVWHRVKNGDEGPEEVSAALDSLKATVFDLTVLLSSIEGKADGPGFLMHDSPREADLMLPIYHRIFRELARWTESFEADQAPFQYIITTTTAPPDELKGDKWVNQPLLDASHKEGRLLGEDL